MIMANMNKIPSSLQGGGEDLGNSVMSQMLIELLRELSLNKNFFTTDLSDDEDTEILEAYGYLVHITDVKDNDGNMGRVSVALPSSLSEKETQKVLKAIKTYDDALMYFPKIVLERENRKLYVKLMKKLINDCNS